MIQSKSYLKNKVLHQMMLQGKIEKAEAHDMAKNSKAGWRVVPHKAFRNTDPVILAQMKPLP
jgi:secreted Zn-dependent insulinase-like peptidase